MSWAHLVAESALSYADAMKGAYSALSSFNTSSNIGSVTTSMPDPIGTTGAPISWKSPLFDTSNNLFLTPTSMGKWVKDDDGCGYHLK